MLILIAADAGRLRNGIYTILTSYVNPEQIGVADTALSVFWQVNQHRPRLLILDFNVIGLDQLCNLRQRYADVYHMVLVDKPTQQHLAFSVGADAVLLKGFSAAHFFDAMTQVGLVSQVIYPEELSNEP